jgi:hypothetical protein
MNTSTTYQTLDRKVSPTRSADKGIKPVLMKIVKALSFDSEAIFRSKDWPHLWPK